VYNPVIHRINQAIRQRAIYPDKPVVDTPENLLRFSRPPEALIDQAKPQIESLIDVAEVKKVPPKARGRFKREQVKPVSGLDVDALLGQQRPATRKNKISAANSIPEFKQTLASTGDLSVVEDSVKQMAEIIRSHIANSLGESGYGRAAENMRVMRDELINFEEPGMYNSFVKDLKKRLLAGELNGDRRKMWLMVGWERLGLITKEQSEGSDVTTQEADEVSRLLYYLLYRREVAKPRSTVLEIEVMPNFARLRLHEEQMARL
jgi:ATP-dependent DNA helicase 2 subunit 2